MKTQHTSGPWRIEPAKGTLCAWKIDSPSKPIAFVTQTLNNNQEENANARLIAAAPDLLAALKDILEHVPDDDGQSSLPIQRQRQQAALDAIAAAEGKEAVAIKALRETLP